MLQPRLLDIKVRKAGEQPRQEVVYGLAAVADGTKWCKLVARAVKGRNRSGDIMSFLGCYVFLDNGLSALWRLSLEEVVIALRIPKNCIRGTAVKQE